ncbi:hypothetical protein D9M71_753940 [compost metagenome]
MNTLLSVTTTGVAPNTNESVGVSGVASNTPVVTLKVTVSAVTLPAKSVTALADNSNV